MNTNTPNLDKEKKKKINDYFFFCGGESFLWSLSFKISLKMVQKENWHQDKLEDGFYLIKIK